MKLIETFETKNGAQYHIFYNEMTYEYVVQFEFLDGGKNFLPVRDTELNKIKMYVELLVLTYHEGMMAR